jgi:hypothetical protein
MADRQLKLPLNAKPVTRVVPPRLGAAKRPMLAKGNNETAGAAAAKPPALVVRVISGAPRPQSETK